MSCLAAHPGTGTVQRRGFTGMGTVSSRRYGNAQDRLDQTPQLGKQYEARQVPSHLGPEGQQRCKLTVQPGYVFLGKTQLRVEELNLFSLTGISSYQKGKHNADKGISSGGRLPPRPHGPTIARTSSRPRVEGSASDDWDWGDWGRVTSRGSPPQLPACVN